jgi:hypothetical protein
VESEEQEREELAKIFTFTFGPRTFFFLRKIKGFLADKTSEILLTLKGLVHI